MEQSYTIWVDTSGLHWRLSLKPSSSQDARTALEAPTIEAIVELLQEDDPQLSFQFE
jgi:hypothetical protein